MTRALAVVALVGCACGQPSNVPVTTRPASPTCPAVPTVDLPVCPLDRPSPSLVVTEPADDSFLLRGVGFWCTAFRDGKWEGQSDCLRDRGACEEWRRRYGKHGKASECRPAERASCVKVIDYKRLALYYRCVSPDRCEAMRADMIAKHPELGVGACQEFD